jgi:hypothetical protein
MKTESKNENSQFRGYENSASACNKETERTQLFKQTVKMDGTVKICLGDRYNKNELTVSIFGMTSNGNEGAFKLVEGAVNENDVTISIFYLVCNRNDVTVTLRGNDAHLCAECTVIAVIKFSSPYCGMGHNIVFIKFNIKNVISAQSRYFPLTCYTGSTVYCINFC